MSKTSDKICSWKCTNISDEICSQSWRHAEHWGWHDEEVHCRHQVRMADAIILQKFWFAKFTIFQKSKRRPARKLDHLWQCEGLQTNDHLFLIIFIMRCIWALLIRVYLCICELSSDQHGGSGIYWSDEGILHSTGEAKIQPKLFMIAVKDNME